MRITILGCGSSSGVPMIGCTCAVCRSDNPKNKRSRVSVFIEINGKNLLIDTSPDLRAQMLANHISRVDAVLYTHDHADHTHGIDDLRSFNYLSGNTLPVYCDQATCDSLLSRFGYAFGPKPDIWYRPSLKANLIQSPNGKLNILDISIAYFEQLHGKVKTIGYRIGNFAYSTDLDGLPEAAFEALEGTEIWVVDCLRKTKSHAHAHLEMTMGWIGRVKPKLAVLTHMSHDMDYDELTRILPSGVVPGYDGMAMELEE